MLFGAAHLQAARAGPAINQFEVKDLEVEVGRWEFQSQNAFSWDQPERGVLELAPGDFVFDQNTVVRQRYALELERGMSQRFRSRFGIELEQSRVDDPSFVNTRDDFESLELEELALESVYVFVPIDETGFGVGLLAEYQYTVDADEADSFVLGPIIEAAGHRWSAVLNPAVVRFFGGADGDDKLDFSYALQLAYAASDTWLWALEAYGTIDRIGGTGNPGDEVERFGDHDLHRMGPIAYYRRAFGSGDRESELRVGAGIFAGLNDDTPGGTFKLSIEYEF